MRRPQKHQKKGPVAEVADAAAVDAALDRVAAVVDGADGPVDAAQLPTVYAALHGEALDARALGFRKLGALLDVGAARGLWALERVPRRQQRADADAGRLGRARRVNIREDLLGGGVAGGEHRLGFDPLAVDHAAHIWGWSPSGAQTP